MGDVRNWNEQQYRDRIRHDIMASSRIVFAARFAPAPSPPDIVATSCSDGSVNLYSISSCIPHQPLNLDDSKEQQVAGPLLRLAGHNGAAYDLQFYGEGEDALLLSCGDDGRIQGWRWQDVLNGIRDQSKNGITLDPAFDLKNPQEKGPWGALSSMPETNAIATNSQGHSVFSAAGNGLAYSWDIEKEKINMVFKGHSDYIHCICSRPSHNQVITGSEDGTARIWDCRSGYCTAILDAWRAVRLLKSPKEKSPWISCVAIDSSENWLVCGNGGRCVTLWSLPGLDAVTRIATLAPPQAITIANDEIVTVGAQPHLSRFGYGGNVLSQVTCAPLSAFSVSVHPSGITAVGGYGGLVDIISEFGSHICIFRCN